MNNMPLELCKAIENLPEVAISREHAQFLSELIVRYKTKIEKSTEINAPRLVEYCDELLEALRIESEE
jgi:hypothetical protein